VNPVKTNQPVHLSQLPFQPGEGGFPRPFTNGYPYPGVGSPYSNFLPSAPVNVTPASPASSGFNLGQIKDLIDRMGGIEGVMANVTKVQSFIKNMQQMAPMFKLLLNSFGSKAATTNVNSKLDGLPRPRRRQNRRRAANPGLKKNIRPRKR
jgi:hypothetical protein